MSSKGLQVGKSFAFPLEAVTETFGILAVKRAGKSNAAVVMAEEMYAAGIPWVAIDPKGDWYGVRAGADDKTQGLAVLVFGGLHGDIPLEPTAGRLIADLVAEDGLTCVLDVSEMSKADQRRFLYDFADRLYRKNTEPLHVFCEEADEYCPQMVRGESAKVVGAFETLVKRGGFKGLGVTLITQRSASLNKDVLTQVGTLVVLRTTSPQDQKAILDWIKYHAEAAETIAELPGLENGQAYVYSPQWLRTLSKIQFRQRRTFDSGSTPKVGVKTRQPIRLADIDLGEIKERMSETIERAKADDPKELRKRITVLERELKSHKCPKVDAERVEVSIITQADVEMMRERIDQIHKASFDLGEVAHNLLKVANGRLGAKLEPKDISLPVPSLQTPKPRVQRVEPQGETSVQWAVGDPLPKAQRCVLTVLAQYPQGRNKSQTGLLAGYSPKSGGFNNALAWLRTRDLIDGPGSAMRATPLGIEALGEFEELPTGVALQAYWLARLPKAERAVLGVLLGVAPQSLSKQEIAEQTGYSDNSGGFNNALSKLRKLELIEGFGEIVAAEALS